MAPLTHATYESHVRWYLDPGIGKIRLDRLRVSDVQSWLNKLQSQCQCCAQGKDAKRAARDLARAKCCAKGECCRSYPSGRTIKDLRGVLRSALSSAMTEELVSHNVATMVRAPRLRPRKIVPWSSEEARRFLESARNDADSFYAVFVLVLVLGLRKGEVLGLSWSAVDMQACELTIDQQLQRVRRELLLRQTKTAASDGTLPIPNLVATAGNLLHGHVQPQVLIERREKLMRTPRAVEQIWPDELATALVNVVNDDGTVGSDDPMAGECGILSAMSAASVAG